MRLREIVVWNNGFNIGMLYYYYEERWFKESEVPNKSSYWNECIEGKIKTE